jgi:hypothetical protein
VTTHFSQSLLGSLDTAIAGTSLNALGGSGSYAMGAAINNTPTDGTTVSYDLADLTITLSSAVTAGSGTPTLVVYVLPEIDATNYPTPPGSSAGAAPANLIAGTYVGVASASTSTIVVTNIPIPPYNFKIMIQNNLGIALPATNTSTCQIQRKTVANW